MKQTILAMVLLLLIVGCTQIDQTQTNISDAQDTDNDIDQTMTQGVLAEEVAYYNNVAGYLARPNDEGVYPGVVMIHEWWGLNENIKKQAEELASEGYTVLAVDLYQGRVATEAAQARELVSSLDQQEALENMRAAIQYLEQEQGSEQIASLGWCFGGGQSMQLALSGEDLDATIIYYGNLETDEGRLEQIDWPVLGIFGSEDASIPVSVVQEFNRSLQSAGVQREIYIYDGVGHAFANPSGDNFAEEEAQDAWTKTLNFLNATLKTS